MSEIEHEWRLFLGFSTAIQIIQDHELKEVNIKMLCQLLSNSKCGSSGEITKQIAGKKYAL